MNHKYDNRGAGDEGRFAQQLYDTSCKTAGRTQRNATTKEDCAGVDRYEGDKAIDVKARKNRLPTHTCWIEVSAAGGKTSGWVYKPKWIAQLMVYEKDNNLTDVFFGEYHTNDLVELLKSKVDFNSNVSNAQLYKLYTRWWEGKHRGTMTVVSYEDLESLKSFSKLPVPESEWDKVKTTYNLK